MPSERHSEIQTLVGVPAPVDPAVLAERRAQIPGTPEWEQARASLRASRSAACQADVLARRVMDQGNETDFPWAELISDGIQIRSWELDSNKLRWMSPSTCRQDLYVLSDGSLLVRGRTGPARVVAAGSPLQEEGLRLAELARNSVFKHTDEGTV